jgi:hypothetical protein
MDIQITTSDPAEINVEEIERALLNLDYFVGKITVVERVE